MAPRCACMGKVASAVTKKNEWFIKKPQSPIMGDLQKQLSSNDDEDQHDPEKATTSGLIPEGLKNLCGVSAGPNTPRTPWYTTLPCWKCSATIVPRGTCCHLHVTCSITWSHTLRTCPCHTMRIYPFISIQFLFLSSRAYSLRLSY